MKFTVEKSTHINAPKETVRPLIADFEKWSSWSPWHVIEPTCDFSVEGSAGNPGHVMKWNGEIIGGGTNTISRVEGDSLYYDLEFSGPWSSKAQSAIHIAEQDGGTKVTWTLDGSMPFFLFFMTAIMKNWVGMDYDRGLRMLKEVAEKGAVHAKTTHKGIVDIAGFSYVGLQRTVAIGEVGDKMKADFEKIIADVVQKHNVSAEHWVSLYPKFDMKNMTMTYIAGISDENLKNITLGSEYVRGSVEAGKALEITHDGSYDFLGNAWSMGMMYMRGKKLKQRSIPFERYWNSPLETPENELKTSIFFPTK